MLVRRLLTVYLAVFMVYANIIIVCFDIIK